MRRIATMVLLSTMVLGPALLVGCSADPTQEQQLGQFNLPLTAQGTSGTLYHLSGVFDVAGPNPQQLAADGDSTSLSVGLATGNYTIALQPGWQLARVEGNTLIPVVATLVSANPQPFVINQNAVTQVAFNFTSNGDEVGFGNGELLVTINVDDVVPESNCQDGIDNDNNGFSDCADINCATAPVCVGAENSDSRCSNGFDDDNDGLTDCADPQCAPLPVCLPSEAQCSGGLDEDNDGLTDCADPDCTNAPVCTGLSETNQVRCSNGFDDDNDGLTDCADPQCAAFCP